MNKIEREKATIGLMTSIYCNRKHATHPGTLCDECRSLLEYAMTRIDLCPVRERKKSCRKCEIHCYAADKRERIRNVMKYVGPRMIFIHPVMTLRHLISEL